MPRTRTPKDPATHLKDLVVKRGESESFGTVFYGANLVVNPDDHAHSDSYDDARDVIQTLAERSEEYRKFIAKITHGDSYSLTFLFPSYFDTEGCLAYFRGDADSRAVNVTFVLKEANVKLFDSDVEILSHIAAYWARLANREIKEMRIFVNQAFITWEDMEQDSLLYNEYESD